MSTVPFHISALAMMLFGYSHMIDSGTAQGITLAEAKRHVSAGDLFDWLREKNGGSFAGNFDQGTSGFAQWYIQRLDDNCSAMEGRERRKYAIENNGIALLISYTAEIIQAGENITLKHADRVQHVRAID